MTSKQKTLGRGAILILPPDFSLSPKREKESDAHIAHERAERPGSQRVGSSEDRRVLERLRPFPLGADLGSPRSNRQVQPLHRERMAGEKVFDRCRTVDFWAVTEFSQSR